MYNFNLKYSNSMKVYFTICSNNYLAYATVLGRSLKRHEPGAVFYIFLCDKKIAGIDYPSLADEVIAVETIEPAMQALSLKYNIIELNTCVKPRVMEYLLNERDFDKVIYLDPDVQVFHSLAFLETDLERANILLTPHIYTPIPLDDKQPSESVFLNYGLYNLGFIALRQHAETNRFLAWWKERTYAQGFIDVYNGIFVDQLPVNFVPLFFTGVVVLQDRGLNMAPWNLHERMLSLEDNRMIVNKTDWLKFYHFSSIVPGVQELPVFRYNRFTLHERPDLASLYNGYIEALQEAGHVYYSKLENKYAAGRRMHLRKQKRNKWMDWLLMKKGD